MHFLKISGAPPEEVEELVSEKLGTNVVEISDSLFGLMEELCTGNPLMITELVSHLKVRARVRIRVRVRGVRDVGRPRLSVLSVGPLRSALFVLCFVCFGFLCELRSRQARVPRFPCLI